MTLAPSGVFDEDQARDLSRADLTHWWFASKARYVADVIAREAPGARVLVDLGAGAGGVTSAVGQKVFPIAVEGAADLVAACRVRGLSAVRATVSSTPVAAGRVDVVTLLDVIEHLPDPVAALAEARRILAPRGLLVVTVPAHAWLWSEADVVLGHVKRYRRGMLRAELRAAGLEPILCTHIFSWLVPPVAFVRSRPSSDGLGLDRDGSALRTAARVLTRAETALVRTLPLPVGTSVLCAARPV